MFDLPELDEPIIRQLNRHDLAQCARVSRTWHRIVVPFLWAVFGKEEPDVVSPSRVFSTYCFADAEYRAHGKPAHLSLRRWFV